MICHQFDTKTGRSAIFPYHFDEIGNMAERVGFALHERDMKSRSAGQPTALKLKALPFALSSLFAWRASGFESRAKKGTF